MPFTIRQAREDQIILKRACEILLRKVCPERMCGYVRNIGREGTEYKICTLEQLKDEQVDMFTTVFIGNYSKPCGERKACDRA